MAVAKKFLLKPDKPKGLQVSPKSVDQNIPSLVLYAKVSLWATILVNVGGILVVGVQVTPPSIER